MADGNKIFTDDDFKAPSGFFFKDALGDFIFIKTRVRKDAQAWIDLTYGYNKYKVRADIKASVR